MFWLFVIIFNFVVVSNAQATESTLSLSELLAIAREKNPDVRAAHQAWKVSQALVSPAAAWPDPTFTFIDEKFPSGMDGVGPERVKHSRVEQPIPFPGKLTNESKMKFHEALIAESQYRARLLGTLRDVKMRFYQLYLTDEKIALAQESVNVLKNALQTAQNRLGAGKSSAIDVFMAGTELHKMENALYEQQQQRTLISIEINTLLNRPTESLLGRAQKPVLIDLPLTLDEFRQVARRNTPEYQRAMHEVNHSRAMTHRNRLQWAPDFGVMYERETANSGDPGQQIGVNMTFPLWFSRPWGEQRAAREHEQEAVAMGESMQNMVLKMIHTEVTQTETHLTEARTYETSILPSALTSLRTARQQYASGQGDFLRLLEAFRLWIGAHNEYQNEVYHYGEHWSELGRWLGVDVAQAKEALGRPMEKHHE